jgi:hypothetical protein
MNNQNSVVQTSKLSIAKSSTHLAKYSTSIDYVQTKDREALRKEHQNARFAMKESSDS